jgi:hypothetical protein
MMDTKTTEPGPDIQAIMKFSKRKYKSPERYVGKSAEEEVRFYQEILHHLLIQMNMLEMKAVCLLCGHYPLHEWACPVVERFNAEFADTRAYAGIEYHYVRKTRHVGGDHAGKWETSYLWYLRPDCVDLSVYRGREDEPLVGAGAIDPRKEASVEVGRKACDLIVQGMVRKAEQLLALLA